MFEKIDLVQKTNRFFNIEQHIKCSLATKEKIGNLSNLK